MPYRCYDPEAGRRCRGEPRRGSGGLPSANREQLICDGEDRVSLSERPIGSMTRGIAAHLPIYDERIGIGTGRKKNLDPPFHVDAPKGMGKRIPLVEAADQRYRPRHGSRIAERDPAQIRSHGAPPRQVALRLFNRA